MPTTVTGNGRSHVLALINAAVVDQTRRQTTNLSFNMPNSARGHWGQVFIRDLGLKILLTYLLTSSSRWGTTALRRVLRVADGGSPS